MMATSALEVGEQCRIHGCWSSPTHQCLDCEHAGRRSLFCEDCWWDHECVHVVNFVDELKPRCSSGVLLPTGCAGPYHERRDLVDLEGNPVNWTPCMAATGDFGPYVRDCWDTADVRILAMGAAGLDFCRRCSMDPRVGAIQCHCLS